MASYQIHGTNRRSAATHDVSRGAATPNMSADFDVWVTRANERSTECVLHVTGNLWPLFMDHYPAYRSRDSETGNWYQGMTNSNTSRYGYAFEAYVTFWDKRSNQNETRTLFYKPNGGQYQEGYGIWFDYFSDGEQQWYFDAGNGNTTVSIQIYGGCYDNEGCSGGDYSFDITVGNPTYVDRVEPGKATDGCVYSTGNTNPAHQSEITDYLHREVWFDWWGQSAGTVGLKQANVDITVNDSNGDHASSVDITQSYVQNTHLSLYQLAVKKGAHYGDTLYCWVNILSNEDVWLGRQYLGRIVLNKRGRLYTKNGGNREIKRIYAKTGNTQRKIKYIYCKDSNGNQRIIDMYTELY